MKLENSLYRVEVDARNGAVVGLFDKTAGLELIAEPRLAESWRVLLPTADKLRQSNYIASRDQRPPRIGSSPAGLTLTWRGPLAGEYGRYDLTVTARIELVGQCVQFRIDVQNRSNLTVTEVWHAGLGGLLGLGERTDTRTLLPANGAAVTGSLFVNFPESMGPGGGGGFRSTEFHATYPTRLSMPWFSLYNPTLGRGVYYGCHDPVARFKTLRFEMHPSLARNRVGTNWPGDAEIASMSRRHPAGVVMHWVHTPFLPPGGEFQGPPVVLQCHDGDWHAAAKVYRRWFTSRFTIRPQTAWLRQAQAVYDVMFLLPEGNVLHTFKEIGPLARDAARYGVKTMMISGWWTGGHDNQYPDYRPDRRLGTWEDLRRGIAAAHRAGVKVLFFANIQTVDVSTDWYRRRLHRYRTIRPNGISGAMSFGMGTLLARQGQTAPPLGNCEPAIAGWRRIIVERMARLAAIGADGVHYDKVCAWELDCNPLAGVSPDRAMMEGVIECMEETLRRCRRHNARFCLGVEASLDRLLPYCDAWWNWIDGLDHVSAAKYAFPEWLPTFAVVQAYDYNSVNNAIRFAYQLLIGPAHWSQSMHDPQMRPLSRYIREVIRIREALKDTIFLGDFLDDQEAAVKPAPNLRFNSHRDRATGRRACVLVNLGDSPVTTSVRFEGNARGRAAVHKPFERVSRTRFPARLTIPPERLAVVVEE